MADAIMAEIEMLSQQVADLEARTAGTPEAEAVRARVMARFEEVLLKAQKEFGTSDVVKAPTPVCEHSENTLRKAFDLYDVDKSGFLENSEIIALAKQLGSPHEESELRESITLMDTSDDGKVSFDEFSVFMRKEGAGKMANKLRAKLLKGKLGDQLGRIKAVADKAGAKSFSPPEGVERKFDVAVTVGGMQPDEDTAVKADFQVTALPRAEISEEERLTTAKITFAVKAGVGADVVATCIEQMQNLYNMARENMGMDQGPLRGFDAEHTGETLVTTLKIGGLPLNEILDQMVFFHGSPGAASLQASGTARTCIDCEKLVTATLDSPLDLTETGKFAMSVVATVSNDTWFENLVNMFQRMGGDSDDEGEGDEGATAEAKFAKLPFIQKVQKKVMPKLAWWMSGLRARFAFASVSELLGKFSDNGPNDAKEMKSWTLELAHYRIAQILGSGGADAPEEAYSAFRAAVGGVCKLEIEIKAGFGDVQGTADFAGLGRIAELLPPFELFGLALCGELVKPQVPASAPVAAA